MVAFLNALPLLALLSTRAPLDRNGALPSDVPDSQGRVPYNHQPEARPLQQLAQDFFPGSLSGGQVLWKALQTLHRHGLDKSNTLVALSVCPDEINHKVGDLTDLVHQHFGREFHLGGLGGIPFTGKTGFSAFSHHVREQDGNCFVVYAPHIGLSSAKNLGMCTTEEDKERTSCGAAVGALQYCLAEKEMPSLSADASDYQEEYIIQQIKKRQDEIMLQESDNAIQATLAQHMWKIGKDKLDQVVNTDFGGPRSKLMVLTGVMINMPRPHADLFQPLTFELHLKDGTILNVFEETFGRHNPRPVASNLKP